MKEFRKIELICEENRRLCAKVIDEFLLHYAAQRNNLGSELELHFGKYKHITNKFQLKLTRMLKGQYLAHRIFRMNGLIKKYLPQTALKKLGVEERNYLEFQAGHPWKFSFGIIKEIVSGDFYNMKDVFSGEELLLYSPSMSDILKDQSVILWFNLISFNGACWQTYGPITAYKSFEPDDIFFFATELKSDIVDEEDLIPNLEQNPVPYMMLLSGASFPPVFNKKDQIVYALSEYDIDDLNTKKISAKFQTEYNNGIYKLSLKKWDVIPHYSCAFFDEKKKIILLSSMTDRGFNALAKALNEFGYNFRHDPSIRVNFVMINTASEILKKEIILNEYQQLFVKKQSKASEEDHHKINDLLAMMIPDINAGRVPDIELLASQSGVDPDTARELLKQILKKVKK